MNEQFEVAEKLVTNLHIETILGKNNVTIQVLNITKDINNEINKQDLYTIKIEKDSSNNSKLIKIYYFKEDEINYKIVRYISNFDEYKEFHNLLIQNIKGEFTKFEINYKIHINILPSMIHSILSYLI